MRVGLLTREYPPDVYGGAGVHVDNLARHLRTLVDLDVFCMGDERPGATAFAERDDRFPDANSALHIVSTDLAMTAAAARRDPAHAHRWLPHPAGRLPRTRPPFPPRDLRSAHRLHRPGDDGRCRAQRPRALAHLVRQPGRT